MNLRSLLAAAAALAFLPAVAQAQAAGPYTLFNPVPDEELRDFCADRPGAGTPACTLDAGHFAVEVGVFGAQFDRQDDIRVTSYSAADLLFRAGLTSSLEAQIGFSPFNEVRVRDRLTGDRVKVSGAGDLSFSVRQNLSSPDGSGVSVAVQPYVTAPTGSDDFTNDTWTGGVIVPVSIDLGGDWSLSVVPEVDYVGDADGDGHHYSYAGVIGIGRGLGDFGVGAELVKVIDDDPLGSVDQTSVELSGSWIPPRAPGLQFDAGVNAGLNDDTPDLTLYAGVARRF